MRRTALLTAAALAVAAAPSTAGAFVQDQPPTAPPGVHVVSLTGTTATIAWGASSDTDATPVAGYRVLGATGSVSGLTFTATGLDCGEDYLLAVRAKDTAGWGSPVSFVKVSTPDCGEPVPDSGPAGGGSGPTGGDGSPSASSTPDTTPPAESAPAAPPDAPAAPPAASPQPASPKPAMPAARGAGFSVSNVVAVAAGHGAKRRLYLTVSASRAGSVRVLVLRGSAIVLARLLRTTTAGNEFALPLPRRIAAGSYTVELTVSDRMGNARVVRRTVRIAA